MEKSSGATNKQRQRDADRARRLEEALAPRRLSCLSPDQTDQARRLMDDVLLGRILDPDAPLPESDDE